ncbi:MAG: HDOD domain-containing protein [Lentisphaerales bacterium]|nr:HDOD domain-containing protein [Lentisphaerales bacterium]
MYENIIGQLREELTSGSIELPMLPEVAQKVIAMTSNEDCDASQLSNLIHRDQSLAGNILKITNSATYAGNIKIVSLQQAIARLGINRLREIALAVSVQNSLFNVPGQEKAVHYLWKHSLASSAYAKEIARSRRRNVESAYLCGLLHTIGKPIVLKSLHQICRKEKVEFTLEETLQILEEEHKAMSLRMAKEWDLPEQVIQTVEFFDHFQDCDNFEDEVYTVVLAHLCADDLTDVNALSEEELSEHDIIDLLNMYLEDLEEVLNKKEKILELISSMG